MLEDDVDIGPFAHLRKGAHLAEGVHMGNFGEVKNSYLGPGTKMGHFSYIGDADDCGQMSTSAPVRSPAIMMARRSTPPRSGTGVFIGSDTMLVAPVKMGEGARTGAGSVVTHDVVPAHAGGGRAGPPGSEVGERVTSYLLPLASLLLIVAFDLLVIACRASYLQTSQARLLAFRAQHEARVNRATGLLLGLPRLRASLNLALVAARFLCAWMVLWVVLLRPLRYPQLVALAALLTAPCCSSGWNGRSSTVFRAIPKNGLCACRGLRASGWGRRRSSWRPLRWRGRSRPTPRPPERSQRLS